MALPHFEKIEIPKSKLNFEIEYKLPSIMETKERLIDSDVIDVTASHTKVSILNHAIPYNKALLLFSDQTQFIIPSDSVLTPTQISLKVSTEYPCDTGVKPLANTH